MFSMAIKKVTLKELPYKYYRAVGCSYEEAERIAENGYYVESNKTLYIEVEDERMERR